MPWLSPTFNVYQKNLLNPIWTRYGWTDGLLFKLFIELGVGGRMWLTIKDLYTDVKPQDLYSGSLSRQFKVSQGQVKGEYLPPLCTRFILMPCWTPQRTMLVQFLSVEWITRILSLFCWWYFFAYHSTVVSRCPYAHMLLLQLEEEIWIQQFQERRSHFWWD